MPYFVQIEHIIPLQITYGVCKKGKGYHTSQDCQVLANVSC